MYQKLAEKRVIDGDFQPYLNHVAKVRNFYRAGDRQATYDGVNQFMAMLEACVGGEDAHGAEALWNFCYKVTPDEYHARDRHVRAKGELGLSPSMRPVGCVYGHRSADRCRCNLRDSCRRDHHRPGFHSAVHPPKAAYELYDPAVGRNFDLKKFWMRADLRVRQEWRNGSCFGGACNSFGGFNGAGGASATSMNGQAGLANPGRNASDFYIQQWARLGIGYDLSPDVNFYLEIIDSAIWGGNGGNLDGGDGGDSLTHNGGIAGGGGNNGRLGVRAAYVLIGNLSGVQGLSLKAGRQYLVFGNNSLFGHFDWANTGFSHDGVMLSYSTKTFDSYLGWFRNSESDIGQAAPVGSSQNHLANGASGTLNNGSANLDADMIIFYNQLKSISGFLIEPFYVYYRNNYYSADNAAQGLGTPKHSQQLRHMIGNRTELRKGNWDAINETAWQFGHMADGLGISNQCNVSINAWGDAELAGI